MSCRGVCCTELTVMECFIVLHCTVKVCALLSCFAEHADYCRIKTVLLCGDNKLIYLLSKLIVYLHQEKRYIGCIYTRQNNWLNENPNIVCKKKKIYVPAFHKTIIFSNWAYYIVFLLFDIKIWVIAIIEHQYWLFYFMEMILSGL